MADPTLLLAWPPRQVARQPEHGVIDVSSDTRIGERALIYVPEPEAAVVAWCDLAGPARRVGPRRWVCWGRTHHLKVAIDRDICRSIDPVAFHRPALHRHLDVTTSRELAALIGLDPTPTLDPHLDHPDGVASSFDWVVGDNDELWPDPTDALAAIARHEPSWRRLGATQPPTPSPPDPQTARIGGSTVLATADLTPNLVAELDQPTLVLVTRAIARTALRGARAAHLSIWAVGRRNTIPLLRRVS